RLREKNTGRLVFEHGNGDLSNGPDYGPLFLPAPGAVRDYTLSVKSNEGDTGAIAGATGDYSMRLWSVPAPAVVPMCTPVPSCNPLDRPAYGALTIPGQESIHTFTLTTGAIVYPHVFDDESNGCWHWAL